MLKKSAMNKPTLQRICGLIIVFTLLPFTTFSQNAYTKLCLEAISYEKSGNLDEAVNKYTEAIRLKPQEWTGYNYRAKVNLQRGRYDDAISDATRALTLSPQTLSLYAVRANCHEANGMYGKAIDDYNMALSKTGTAIKDAYLTYYQRGRSYFFNAQFREAIDDFDKALSSAPKYWNSAPEIYSLRAQSNLELRNYTEAIRDLDQYIAVRPDDVQALFFQGYAYLKNGDKERARASANRLLQLDPAKQVFFSGSNLLNLFDLDMRRAKSEKLAKDAQTLISEQSSAPSRSLATMKLNDAFGNLDTAWLYLPELTKADLALKETIREKLFTVYPLMKAKPEVPEFVRKYVVQATSATDDKKYDDAIGLWTTTINISPCLPLAYYNRSLLYEMKGQIRNSISDMEKYLALAPDASDARSSRDKIYEWEGKIKDQSQSQTAYKAGAVNQIESGSYSPGTFRVAIATGGTFGVQIAKNPDLSNLWTASTNGATPDYDYSDKLPFLFSGDLEITIKPIKRVAIGAFGKITGGIGARTKVGEVKYMMDMGTTQYGGLLRYYFLLNNGAERPDVYIQYGFGKSDLNGYYGIATMDGIIFDYSYMKQFDASDYFHTAGVGMGGKIGRHGYLTLSLDYLTTKFDDITWEVTANTAVPSDVGSKGSLDNVTANYNGVVLKLLFGVCF